MPQPAARATGGPAPRPPAAGGGEVPAIDVRDLVKRFGEREVVKGISLTVGRGEIFGFLGPNGSGKTTTIRMMCGLLTPDGGSGTCLGYDILRESDAIKRHIGYMTQRFSFWEDLTIRENLDFTARVFEMPDARAAVDGTLARLGLRGRERQLAGQLSGGWKQRLALAACMLHRPALLLLDEPTAGVDPHARREFWDELHALAEAGISVLVSTHYMDEAERCHKLAYIADGRLLATGSAAEIIASQAVATFEVTGPGASGLAATLATLPGVEETASFGNALHASGTDVATLERSLREATAGKDATVRRIDTSLEDVFIHLMSHEGRASGGAGGGGVRPRDDAPPTDPGSGARP